MKTKGIWGGIVLPLLMPAILLASSQTLTMSWDITDSSDISGYKMYYAYNSQMANKIFACADYTTPATRSTLTCTFEISQYPFFAQIAAVQSDGSAEILSSPQEIVESESTISRVQGFQIVSSAPNDHANYTINFQPADAPIPDGFQIDSGQIFSETRGYGWATANAGGTRDRNNADSPDQSYDTLIHANPDDSWEISLPSGTYNVSVCVGDPSWPTDSTNTVRAEGTVVIADGVLSSDHPWIEKSVPITVSDGRLTLTFTGSDPQAKLCWVKITSL